MTDTARLLALLEAATPGPWFVRDDKFKELQIRQSDSKGLQIRQADGSLIVATVNEAAAQLIAEAVNALPGLIEEVERLRAVIEIMVAAGLVEREKIDQAERIYRNTKEALNAKG